MTVYPGVEASSLQTMGSKTLARDLCRIVDAYVRVTDTFDDDIDALCVQVEETVAADYTLNGLAKNTVLTPRRSTSTARPSALSVLPA